MSRTAQIDAVLAEVKSLAGTPRWTADAKGTISRLVAPVSVDGIIGDLSLRAAATLFTNPQRGSAALVYEGRPIQRMSIRPDHAHVNPLAAAIATDRGVRLAVGRTRLHAWSSNRSWPRDLADNASVAQAIEPEPASFSDALALFLLVCCIQGIVPPPPWEPRLL